MVDFYNVVAKLPAPSKNCPISRDANGIASLITGSQWYFILNTNLYGCTDLAAVEKDIITIIKNDEIIDMLYIGYFPSVYSLSEYHATFRQLGIYNHLLDNAPHYSTLSQHRDWRIIMAYEPELIANL